MRKLNLENIYTELLQISSKQNPANNRFNDILWGIRDDLDKQKGDNDPHLPLPDWWKTYRGLSAYIYR